MARSIPRILAAAAVAAAATVALAQERGSCAVVDVPFPIILPDGTTQDSGTLRICLERRMTPVTVVHRVSVNGMPKGLYLSRTDAAEGPGLPHPAIAFLKDGTGALRLTGYAWPGQEHMRTFRFGPASAALDLDNVVDHLTVTPQDDGAPVWLTAHQD